jgi:hypothetical protein
MIRADKAAQQSSRRRNPHCCSCAATTVRIVDPRKVKSRYARDFGESASRCAAAKAIRMRSDPKT